MVPPERFRKNGEALNGQARLCRTKALHSALHIIGSHLRRNLHCLTIFFLPDVSRSTGLLLASSILVIGGYCGLYSLLLSATAKGQREPGKSQTKHRARIILWTGTVSVGVVIVVLYAINYFFYPNLRTCRQLKKGISERELTSSLGTFTSKDLANGQLVLYFDSHPVAAGPIRARVDKNTGRFSSCSAMKMWPLYGQFLSRDSVISSF